MSQTPNTAIAVIGIDIGKNSFHLMGPFFVWGCPWSNVGRRSDDRPHNGFQDFPCRGPTFTSARLMSATTP